MMPDLPNVGVERDMESFKEFFESPSFRADGLKIYPTLVIRGTGLYELWKTGRYAVKLSFVFFFIQVVFFSFLGSWEVIHARMMIWNPGFIWMKIIFII